MGTGKVMDAVFSFQPIVASTIHASMAIGEITQRYIKLKFFFWITALEIETEAALCLVSLLSILVINTNKSLISRISLHGYVHHRKLIFFCINKWHKIKEININTWYYLKFNLL